MSSIQENAKKILKLAYAYLEKNAVRYIDSAVLAPHLDLSFEDTNNAMYYLDGQGYIDMHLIMRDDFPWQFIITAKGIDWLTDYNQANISKQIFNFNAPNYGAVGTNTNVTINNSFDFDEFENLIKQNTSENSIDRKELEEIKHQLQTITQHNIPISKGYLSKFSDVMQKNSWITGQLSGFLLRWILGK